MTAPLESLQACPDPVALTERVLYTLRLAAAPVVVHDLHKVYPGSVAKLVTAAARHLVKTGRARMTGPQRRRVFEFASAEKALSARELRGEQRLQRLDADMRDARDRIEAAPRPDWPAPQGGALGPPSLGLSRLAFAEIATHATPA